jgi:hypothetical protein
MPERRISVVLAESEVQEFLRVVVDRDPAEALEFLERVVRPQVEAGLRPSGCRPVFELPHRDARPVGPPPVPRGQAEGNRPGGA